MAIIYRRNTITSQKRVKSQCLILLHIKIAFVTNAFVLRCFFILTHTFCFFFYFNVYRAVDRGRKRSLVTSVIIQFAVISLWTFAFIDIFVDN